MSDFLQKLKSSVLVLAPDERTFLDKYGDWLERLAEGVYAPNTERQVQFLAVARGEKPPSLPNEHLWLRVRAALDSTAEVDRLKQEIAKMAQQAQELYSQNEAYRETISRKSMLIARLQKIADKYEPIPEEPPPPKPSGAKSLSNCAACVVVMAVQTGGATDAVAMVSSRSD